MSDLTAQGVQTRFEVGAHFNLFFLNIVFKDVILYFALLPQVLLNQSVVGEFSFQGACRHPSFFFSAQAGGRQGCITGGGTP